MNEPDTRPLPGMIGEHPSMKEVYALVRRAAPTDLTVVIVGETGTGKELVARAVRELSAYRDGPFVDINCAAIPEPCSDPSWILFAVKPIYWPSRIALMASPCTFPGSRAEAGTSAGWRGPS